MGKIEMKNQRWLLYVCAFVCKEKDCGKKCMEEDLRARRQQDSKSFQILPQGRRLLVYVENNRVDHQFFFSVWSTPHLTSFPFIHIHFSAFDAIRVEWNTCIFQQPDFEEKYNKHKNKSRKFKGKLCHAVPPAVKPTPTNPWEFYILDMWC